MSPSILRRITGLLTALLLLQLTLAGGGAACVAHVAGTDGMGAGHRGMSMDARGSPANSNQSTVEPNAASGQLGSGEWQGATRGDPGCPAHGTTPACDSMAACAPVVFSAPITTIGIAAAPTTRVNASHVLAPRTRTTAPELPPPRA